MCCLNKILFGGIQSFFLFVFSLWVASLDFIMDLGFFYLSLVFTIDTYPVIDFFKEKRVNSVLNFNCNNGSIVWNKILNENNMNIASIDISRRCLSSLPYTHNKIGILLDTSCNNWTLILNNFMEKKTFKSPYVWLIFAEDMWSTVDTLSEYYIEIDSDVTVFSKDNETYMFYEVFHRNYYYGNLTVKYIGYWNKQLHLEKEAKRDLVGLKFNCSVVVTIKIMNKTFEEYLISAEMKKADSLHKLKFVSLLNYLSDMYKISFEIQRTNSWGYFRNGSFDGLVGTLQRDEADLGGSPLFFRSDRAQVIDYVAETWVSKQCFILRHPKHPGGFYTIYTRPLAVKVWYCILFMFILSAVILNMMLKIKAPITGEGASDSSFSLALLFTWSAICQQGMTISRSSTAIKMVVFITFVYALTLYQYYNATVVSTLLREPPKNIRTLEDLVRSNLKAGAEDVLYVKDYFKRTTDPVALHMYHKKIIPVGKYNFYTAERGMAMVKRGGYAFHVDSVEAYSIMRNTFSEREICEAHEVPLYPPQKMGFVLRKGSPYREYFIFAIRKFWEAGLMSRLMSFWDEPKPACVRTPDTSVFAVSLLEFSSALLALAAGMATSLMVLIGELVVDKMLRTPNIAFRH